MHKDKNSRQLVIKHEKNGQNKRKKEEEFLKKGVRRTVRESDGFIPIGLASRHVSNSSGRRTASLAVDRAKCVRTLNQVCLDSLH
jgi:hypothetical protein